jgi:hypothetical protein
MEKADGPNADKTEWIKLEFLMDPDWIKWVMAFREIENLMPMKEPADKTRMFRTLLKVQALSYFEHHLMRNLEAENSDNPDN